MNAAQKLDAADASILKIQGAQKARDDRREALQDEHQALALAAAEGDVQASARRADIDREIAALDKEISEAARHLATLADDRLELRKAVEAEAEAARAEARAKVAKAALKRLPSLGAEFMDIQNRISAIKGEIEGAGGHWANGDFAEARAWLEHVAKPGSLNPHEARRRAEYEADQKRRAEREREALTAPPAVAGSMGRHGLAGWVSHDAADKIRLDQWHREQEEKFL